MYIYKWTYNSKYLLHKINVEVLEHKSFLYVKTAIGARNQNILEKYRHINTSEKFKRHQTRHTRQDREKNRTLREPFQVCN